MFSGIKKELKDFKRYITQNGQIYKSLHYSSFLQIQLYLFLVYERECFEINLPPCDIIIHTFQGNVN